nr:TerB family tellurite resistance protein [uncultured Pedobacter sp.]
MKKLLLTLMLCSFYSLGFSQSAEVKQLILNIEKLKQFKNILNDMKNGYRIIDKGYGTIKNLSEGNFNLHEVFLDNLLKISPAVRKYHRVGEIIQLQLRLGKSSSQAIKRFTSAQNFSGDELSYLKTVLKRISKSSLQNLDDLTLILTAGKLRMNDDERLQEIDRIYTDMLDKNKFLIHFLQGQNMLLRNREKELQEVNVLKNNYDIINQ